MSDKPMFVAYCEPDTRERFRAILGEYFGVDCHLCSPFVPMALSSTGKLPIEYYACFSFDIYKNSLRRAKEMFPKSIINEDNTEIEIRNSKNEIAGFVCTGCKQEFLDSRGLKIINATIPL